jgi:hypothetical protein
MNPTLLLIGILIFTGTAFGSSNDTTYGPVLTTDKNNPPPSDPEDQNPTHHSCRQSEDNDTESLWSGFFELIGKGLYYIYIKPVITIADGDACLSKPPRRNSVALSLGNGFILYPGISAGMQLKAEALDIFRFHKQWGLGFKTGINPSFMSIFTDFQRDVYVNNALIGVQKNESLHYFNLQIPIHALIQWFPSGLDGSFHAYVGGGLTYVYEHLKAFRSTTYSLERDTVTINNGEFVPTFTLGLGRIVEGKNVMGKFSLEYSLLFNPYKKNLLLPGDNAKYSHLISLNWAIVF